MELAGLILAIIGTAIAVIDFVEKRRKDRAASEREEPVSPPQSSAPPPESPTPEAVPPAANAPWRPVLWPLSLTLVASGVGAATYGSILGGVASLVCVFSFFWLMAAAIVRARRYPRKP